MSSNKNEPCSGPSHRRNTAHDHLACEAGRFPLTMQSDGSHQHTPGDAAAMQEASSDFSFLALNGGASGEPDAPISGGSGHETVKKRKRKSRKGLEKRFECQVEGCGKSYSRAEHL